MLGNDQTIALCGAAGGQFQLNVMMPVMADAALESVRLLARADGRLHRPLPGRHGGQRRALPGGGREEHGAGHGLESVHRLRAGGRAGQGGLATGKTIRQLAREKKLLPEEQLAEALDPWRMTRPQ